MRHTVEIADSAGNTMQLSVSVDIIGTGGSWRSLTKGMIRYNSGPVHQFVPTFTGDWNVQLIRTSDGTSGIQLDSFISWGTANDEGTGTLAQPWVIGLTPGAIDWTLV
jgi:hypothetical protein